VQVFEWHYPKLKRCQQAAAEYIQSLGLDQELKMAEAEP
jgi:hypothetical protein